MIDKPPHSPRRYLALEQDAAQERVGQKRLDREGLFAPVKHRAGPAVSAAAGARPTSSQHWRSKADQVSAHLLQEIHEGRWREWLPSERELCKLCQASRKTMRSALAHLSELKAVERLPRRGTRVILQDQKPTSANNSGARTATTPWHDIILTSSTEDIPEGYGVCEAIIAADETKKGRRPAGRFIVVPLRAPRGWRYLVRL